MTVAELIKALEEMAAPKMEVQIIGYEGKLYPFEYHQHAAIFQGKLVIG